MDYFDIYKNKNIFLTGHTGFKGSWLGLWLYFLGAKVYGYALKPAINPNHFSLLETDKIFAKNYFADINDIKSLKAAMNESNPEIIFHLAAQPLVRASYKNPYETFMTNVIGTLNILNLARELKNLKAIVIITTDKVYENKEWIWGYREIDALGGYDPYSASKACAELVTSSIRQSFFNIDEFNKTHQVLVASVRAGNVIGGGDWSEDRLIPDLVKAMTKGVKTSIRNPKARRPWQYVLEPLRGYLMLGEKLLNGKSNFATSFNFGPDIESNLNVETLLSLVKGIWSDISYEIKPDINSPHEAHLLMLDISKARNLLGWKPILNIEDTVSMTMQWYKEFYTNQKILSFKQLEEYLKINNERNC